MSRHALAGYNGLVCLQARAFSSETERALEHFQEKWNPVFRPKMRPRNRPRVLSVSMETERTLGYGMMLSRSGWSAPPGKPAWPDHAVHVWRTTLDWSPKSLAGLEQVLSPDERA